MLDTEYDDVWRELYHKRNQLTDKRADLEAELRDANTQIAHLNEVLSHLGVLAGVPPGQDITTMGITDAVRWVLQAGGERMAPKDVRDRLTEAGYDLSSLTAPMASIYKVLGRLAADNSPEPEIVKEKDTDGSVYYRWIKEDIPF